LLTIHVQDVRRRQQTVFVWQNSMKLCAFNWRLTVWEIAEDCNTSVGSCHEILVEKLEMHRVAAKFVPRLMVARSERQSRHRLLRIVRPCKWWWNVHEANYYGWWDMGLWQRFPTFFHSPKLHVPRIWWPFFFACYYYYRVITVEIFYL